VRRAECVVHVGVIFTGFFPVEGGMTAGLIERIQIPELEGVLAQGMAAVTEVTSSGATIAALVPPKLILAQIALRNEDAGLNLQLHFQRGELPLKKAEFMALAALEPQALLRQIDTDGVSLLTVVYQGAAVPYMLLPGWALPLPEPEVQMGRGKNAHRIIFQLMAK